MSTNVNVRFNGREVTNPFARGLTVLFALIVVAAVLGFIFFILLPLIGVGLALLGIAAGAMMLGYPVFRLWTQRSGRRLPPEARVLKTRPLGSDDNRRTKEE